MIITHDNKYKILWDLWIGFLVTFTAIEIPLRLVLDYEITSTIWFIDSVVTACFILDVLLQFKTSVLVKGVWIHDPKIISREYRKTWFGIDLLSAIPFDWILLLSASSPTGIAILRLMKLVRLLKVIKMFYYKSKWRYTVSFNDSIFRLLIFLYFISLVTHWFSCGWLQITFIGDGQRLFVDYIRSLYWCITTLTTIGYGDVSPDKNSIIQMSYTMFVMLIGAGMYGYIIGNIASLLANLDIVKANYNEKIVKINTFMQAHKFPAALQKKVNNYYYYLWETRHGYDDATLIHDLPESFKHEFAMLINGEVLEKVPLLANAKSSIIKELVLEIETDVYTPGDIIVQFGEKGDKMFFIGKGELEVVAENGIDVYATLTKGDFFGEISLLFEQPRTATVRAVGFCDLYTLNKDAFQKVIANYPEFEAEMQQLAKERLAELAKHKEQ